MMGYHYTALSNVESILREGLKPYLLSQDKLDNVRSANPCSKWDGKAVWTWANLLDEVSHAGSILFAATKKGESGAALLRYSYEEKWMLHPEGPGNLAMWHRGAIAKWQYHHREKAVLIIKRIPPKRIDIVDTYDIVQLLKGRGYDRLQKVCNPLILKSTQMYTKPLGK